MNSFPKAIVIIISSTCMGLMLACGALSGGGIPGMPNFAATPASPVSGDSSARIDGGQVIFHIARDGSQINSADLKLSGWHCGGTTLTTSMQVHSSDWSIDGNQFSMPIDLNPPHIEELSFDGTYNESTGTWSGTWHGDEYGAHCGGEWTANK